MGLASLNEDIQKRSEDAQTMDGPIDPTIAALRARPVDKPIRKARPILPKPSRRRSKKGKRSRTPDQYERELDGMRQNLETAQSLATRLQGELAAERLHVDQLRKRLLACEQERNDSRRLMDRL